MEQHQLFDPYEPVEKQSAQSDRDHLLEEMRPVFDPTIRMPFSTLVTALLMLLVIAALFMPKIYLRNAIYYTSRDVAKLEHQYEILRQEKELLQADVEAFRYKNQIEDTLF